jgi:hypothetical protein
MNISGQIKQRLKENAKLLCTEKPESFQGKDFETAFVWDKLEMNFHKQSFKEISKNEKWKKRTEKSHPKVENTFEMQSSNSSDALLMNIFCFPKIFNWKGVQQILQISQPVSIEFGWNPNCFENEKGSKTEIDLKINDTIFEAKLTEQNFQPKDEENVVKYTDLTNVFHTDLLPYKKDKYATYQLIRNILTLTYYEKLNFVLLVDSSRIDIIRDLYDTVNAIKCPYLRKRIRFISWQELIDVCGDELKNYITKKYL